MANETSAKTIRALVFRSLTKAQAKGPLGEAELTPLWWRLGRDRHISWTYFRALYREWRREHIAQWLEERKHAQR